MGILGFANFKRFNHFVAGSKRVANSAGFDLLLEQIVADFVKQRWFEEILHLTGLIELSFSVGMSILDCFPLATPILLISNRSTPDKHLGSRTHSTVLHPRHLRRKLTLIGSFLTLPQICH